MADSNQRTIAWVNLAYGDSGVHVMHVWRHPDTDRHDHVFHELAFVMSGTADHHTASGTQRLRPGDVVVLRPQAWHAYVRPRGFELFNCLIDTPTMSRLASHLKDVVGAFDLYRSRTPRPQQTQPTVLHAPPGEQFSMRERLRGMLSEQRNRRSGWQAAMLSGLLDLLVTVARVHQSTIADQRAPGANGSPPPLAGRSEQAVLDVATHIETHFRESLTLAELSARVHLSGPHLSRCFGKKMGMSLIDYIHRVRSEEACRLLRCTAERVTTIASRVGYAEVAYFSRRFRAQTGQSPRQYRNAWQDTAQYFHPLLKGQVDPAD